MFRTDKILLIILDGWGMASAWGGNAISAANPRFYEKLWRTYPHSQLNAAGVNVGLLPMLKGNSEAGHLNIGAGRVVYEGFTLVSERLRQQPLADNPVIKTAFNNALAKKRPLHLMGLFSSGGIHSHIDHLFDLIDLSVDRKTPEVILHLLTDGRDSDPKSAIEFLDKLKRKLIHNKTCRIATLIGRWWAMDRDSRWDRTRKTFEALVNGVGEYAKDASAVVTDAYRRGITDEFISPTMIIGEKGSPSPDHPVVKHSRIQDGDSIIFFNFRPDRARQITQAISTGRIGHEQIEYPKDLTFVTFIPYQAGLPIIPAFQPDIVIQPLSVVLANHKLRQLHIAESEKYAHVTYFFNGGQEQPSSGEDRVLIPSPKVATYNLTPAMSSYKITETTIKNLGRGRYAFVVVNYASPDMVGHTGIFEAAIQAVLSVDNELKRLIPQAAQSGYTSIITADHGNIEEMVNPTTGEPDTEHTRNPVPLMIATPDRQPLTLRRVGILADVAPTILTLMGLPIPKSMTGQCLVVNKS